MRLVDGLRSGRDGRFCCGFDRSPNRVDDGHADLRTDDHGCCVHGRFKHFDDHWANQHNNTTPRSGVGRFGATVSPRWSFGDMDGR
jgi:hypothetical protein